jgi:ubiquitin carboxyl-terminal hydrolase 34
VVDQAFAQRGVRLLVAVIMDDTRSADPYLMVEVLKVLLLFLRGNSDRMDSEIWSNANMAAERPTEGHLTPYFDNPNAFVERLSDLLLEARGMAADLLLAPDDNTPLRSELAGLIYQALLEACQADGALWDAITDHEDSMVDIHSKLLLDDDYILSERIARHIKLVCQEAGTARAVPNFYWRILWPALGYALEHRENSRPYFTLLVEVLNSDQITQSDQSGVQSLIETLLASLDAYEHHEASSLLIRDEGTAGLLQLLLASVKLLKKFTMQLGLDDLPCRLLRTLLFPRIDIPRARPLVDESSRTLVYDLIRSTFTSGTDYLDLLCITYDAMQTLPHDPTSRYPGAQDWLRFGSNSTGLTNLGMTCYMNSLLQQLFANLQFRKFILDEPVVDCQKQAVLAGLQSLFARMQSAIEPCANTTALAYALNVQIGVQEDVHTFYTTLLSQLEDNMPNQAQKTALTHFFTGKFVTQIKGECGHVSSRVEPFTELSITVKNKANLHDSLDEFVQGEPLEGANKYMCMTCTPGDRGRLVNAMKRTCLDEVPDSLTFCLKRFAFDNMQDGENKVNDRFDFPPEIDISMYKRDYLESPAETQDPDVFELVGVIVHQGSLGYGHYWSYVRVAGQPYDAPGAWLYVEDGITKQCTGGVKAIQQECSGGLAWDDGSERLDSGYVLFYQRRSYIAEANDVNKISKSLRASHGILPRVELPASLAAETEKENLWRTRIASLFEPQFNSFVLWLIGQFPSAIKARNLSAEAMETSEDEEESSPQPDIDNLNARMGDLVAHYALRVVLVDPFGETRLTGLVSGLTTILDAQPATALHVLKPFYMNDLAFNAIARNRNASVRATLLDFIHTCLNCLEAHHPRDYHNILDPIIRMHWSILVSVVEPMPSRWEEYLAFASRLAVQGPKETRMVLDMGYWNWTLGILYIHYDPGLRKLHSKLSTYLKNNGGADHSPLFGFLSDLLSDWVDLSVVYDDIIAAGGDRIRTHIGWSLTSAEIGSLFFLQEKNSSNLWILFLTMCTQCPTRGRSYKHYPPAKLIGYLASHEPLAPPVEQHMLVHFDYEEHSFLQLLWTALHFCMNRNDRQCKNVINTLSKNLVLWEGEEKRSIWFFREASKMAPVSVVESIPLWTLQKNFIFNKTASTRKATANWLADIVFNPDPLSDNSQLDASRIRSTRWLVKECVPLLENAYRTDLQRGRYDSMIEAMESAKQYLAALETEVNSRQTNAATTASADGIAEVEDDSPTDSGSSTTLPAATQPLGSLPQEVRVEYREAAALNQRLEDLLHELLDWEPTETALPTRPIGVRRSVEFDGAEELGIGAEGGLEVDEESDADPEMELGSSSFDDGASDEQN